MSAASDPAEAPGTGTTGLRERRRMATTTEISEAALALFEQRGMAATTIHDIAQAAGVSDRTCFRYFPSKEESVLTLHPVFDAPLDAWLAEVDRGSAPLPQLEAVYERARQAGAARVYWQTHETNTTAQRLYDRVAERSGFIVYRHSIQG